MLKILEALEIRKYLPQGSRAAGQGKRPPSPARADAIGLFLRPKIVLDCHYSQCRRKCPKPTRRNKSRIQESHHYQSHFDHCVLPPFVFLFVVLIITHNYDTSMTNPIQQKEILGSLRGLHTRDSKRQAVACAVKLES